jgi:enterochelin esterase-like enzyme
MKRDRIKSLRKFAGLVGAGLLMAGGIISSVVAATATPMVTTVLPNVPGNFVVIDAFPSAHVAARKIMIWLPTGYQESAEQYSVLYMHDGQNLFDTRTAMGGQTWGVAEHLTRLESTGKVRKTIVVGIPSNALRWREYAPAAAIKPLSPALRDVVSRVSGEGVAKPLADNYLLFLVEELKPFIDKTFRTKPGRSDTFIMGSSMGGLVSLYALASYPDVFGAAGCVSTHWPVSTNPAILSVQGDLRAAEIANAYFSWLQKHLPEAGHHRIYFDHGTINLDSLYAPLQKRVDDLMSQKKYRLNEDWVTQVFVGGDHNEKAWRERLDIPLQFLLRPKM